MVAAYRPSGTEFLLLLKTVDRTPSTPLLIMPEMATRPPIMAHTCRSSELELLFFFC